LDISELKGHFQNRGFLSYARNVSIIVCNAKIDFPPVLQKTEIFFSFPSPPALHTIPYIFFHGRQAQNFITPFAFIYQMVLFVGVSKTVILGCCFSPDFVCSRFINYEILFGAAALPAAVGRNRLKSLEK
jgi:hypothetical protein